MTDNLGPIEVWLTWASAAEIDLIVRYVMPDESTKEEAARALSMQGGQRQVTGDMIARGWQPASRWTTRKRGDSGIEECFRVFRPGTKAQPI